MGVGIFVSFLSMTVSAIVEIIRRDRATKQGYVNDSTETVHTSALWLAPQHALTGIADGLTIVATTINGVGLAASNLLASFLLSAIDGFTSRRGNISWISTNINEGHYDYCSWLLAGLSLLNFMYFLFCSWAYGPSHGEKIRTTDDSQLVVQ